MVLVTQLLLPAGVAICALDVQVDLLLGARQVPTALLRQQLFCEAEGVGYEGYPWLFLSGHLLCQSAIRSQQLLS